MLLRPAVVLTAIAPLSAAQNVFVVAPTPGPGVFSTELQPAIDAAADGDFVLVKSGAYAGFTIAAKAVSVVADSAATVTVDGQVLLQNFDPSAIVLLQGLDVHPSTAGTIGLRSIPTEAASGLLWVDRCRIEGGPAASGMSATPNTPTFSISHTMLRSEVHAGDGNAFASGAAGVAVAFVHLSSWDSCFVGGEGLTTPVTGGAGAFGGFGAQIFGSGTTYEGGAGGADATTGGNGGPGLQLSASSATLVGPNAVGGSGGVPSGGGPAGAPGVPFLAPGGMPPILSPTTRHFVASSPVRENAATTLTFEGAPGDKVAIFVSPTATPWTTLDPLLGAVEIDLAQAQVFVLGTIPASGTLAVPQTLGSLPASTQGAIVFLQSFFFGGPSGPRRLGPPSAIVVLDETL